MAYDSHKIIMISAASFILGAVIYLYIKQQKIKKLYFKSLSHIDKQDADFIKAIKKLYSARKVNK